MKKTTFNLIVDQWSPVPPVETVDLTGKTVMVIGANTGIGFEAATHFARMNPARLILGCRSESKGKAAVAKIESTTGSKSCELWKVDLADFSSVISFAERFRRDSGRLDILVMNAGIAAGEYRETVDGWESTLQVNHLGTALLSLLLLPCLVDTGKKFGSTSRLVIVSSEVHYWAVVPKDVEESPTPVARLSSQSYRDPSTIGQIRYNQTKLLNVLFTRALHDRLQSITPLTVNTVTPGFCVSELGREIQGISRVVFTIIQMFMARTSEQGSRQLVYAAIGGRDNEDRMKGAFINTAAVAECSDFVISAEGKKMQDNLWWETIAVLTKVAPQLNEIVQEYLI